VTAANRKPSVKSIVLNYLEENRPGLIDKQTLTAICRHASETRSEARPVSQAYVLDILSETRVPIARTLGGLPPDLRGRVHFHDREAAAASLLDMTGEYEAARAAGDKIRAADCRRAVRASKDRLKLLLRRQGLSPEKREEKQELLEWFLIWLEAPQLFAEWLELRRKATGGGQAGQRAGSD
jgi:hypothetical protein